MCEFTCWYVTSYSPKICGIRHYVKISIDQECRNSLALQFWLRISMTLYPRCQPELQSSNLHQWRLHFKMAPFFTLHPSPFTLHMPGESALVVCRGPSVPHPVDLYRAEWLHHGSSFSQSDPKEGLCRSHIVCHVLASEGHDFTSIFYCSLSSPKTEDCTMYEYQEIHHWKPSGELVMKLMKKSFWHLCIL